MTHPESRQNPEEKVEHVPTPEEVRAVFTELTGGEYKETRKLEDEKGLYLLEVEVAGESGGQTIEYAYMRKGLYPEGGITATEIHVTHYDNGTAVSGTSAAKYHNGHWTVLK